MLSIHNEPDDRNNYDHVRNEQIKKKKNKQHKYLVKENF